jgi:hypothetical protein
MAYNRKSISGDLSICVDLYLRAVVNKQVESNIPIILYYEVNKFCIESFLSIFTIRDSVARFCCKYEN